MSGHSRLSWYEALLILWIILRFMWWIVWIRMTWNWIRDWRLQLLLSLGVCLWSLGLILFSRYQIYWWRFQWLGMSPGRIWSRFIATRWVWWLSLCASCLMSGMLRRTLGKRPWGLRKLLGLYLRRQSWKILYRKRFYWRIWSLWRRRSCRCWAVACTRFFRRAFGRRPVVRLSGLSR